ncbi:hypothetical protein Ddye_028700, partial [Dipteronia dyeriana]
MVRRITSTDKVDSHNYTRFYQNTKPYYPRPTHPDLQYEETVPYRAYTATTFEGQLFGWWSHTLSLNAKIIIINHTKEIVTNTPTRTSIDPVLFIPSTSTTTTTSQPDGIDVLCYTILIHFVGNPNRLQGKEFSKLQNLKCKKLSDFKWYKDIFLTRVLQ